MQTIYNKPNQKPNKTTRAKKRPTNPKTTSDLWLNCSITKKLDIRVIMVWLTLLPDEELCAHLVG